jgi:ubiquinone/menaquinone biosynthesis C-methylase UbiE
MDRRSHWEGVYSSKRPEELSWYQPHAELSRELILRAVPDRDARILDVGGGASPLAGDLLADGYRHVTVLDIAPAALARARTRLGAEAGRVTWLVADVLSAPFRESWVDLWHDRAVFHFLTDPLERAR